MDASRAARIVRLLRAKADGTDNADEADAFRAKATLLVTKFNLSDADVASSGPEAEGVGWLNMSYMDAMYPYIEQVEAVLAEAMMAVNKMDDLYQRTHAATFLYDHVRGMLDGAGPHQHGFFPLKLLRNDALYALYEALKVANLRTAYEYHQSFMADRPWDVAAEKATAEQWAFSSVMSATDGKRESTVRNLLGDAKYRAEIRHRMVSRNFEEWKKRWFDPERRTWTQRRKQAQ